MHTCWKYSEYRFCARICYSYSRVEHPKSIVWVKIQQLYCRKESKFKISNSLLPTNFSNLFTHVVLNYCCCMLIKTRAYFCTIFIKTSYTLIMYTVSARKSKKVAFLHYFENFTNLKHYSNLDWAACEGSRATRVLELKSIRAHDDSKCLVYWRLA